MGRDGVCPACRYMDYSWGCISHFSTHMRSWLVSPILTRINDAYKTKLESANSQLSALNNQLKKSALTILSQTS